MVLPTLEMIMCKHRKLQCFTGQGIKLNLPNLPQPQAVVWEGAGQYSFLASEPTDSDWE